MVKPTLQQRIGQTLQQHRQALGVSQEAFADMLGMHRTQYGAIEQGRKDCQLSTLLRVAHGMDTKLWQIIRQIEENA